MHDLDHNEDRPRGTYEFPFEFHHIDHTHPRYVMSYHWHVEYEIIRILEGSLTVTLDEKSFTAVKNDVIFVHSGILHSGIPHDCVYQCIVFDMNTFLKNNPVCGEYIQKILHQETMLFPHFSDEHPQILNCISVLFDAMYEKDTGYELTVFGQFYHFFGLIFSNHYFIENPTRTRRDYKRILQLKQVLEFIEKNYANPITLQELSASVSMSPKYFCTRSIQTEGHFGDIKENENFRRFNYRSADKVYKEFMLYAIGRNINKYCRFLNEKLKKFEGKTV